MEHKRTGFSANVPPSNEINIQYFYFGQHDSYPQPPPRTRTRSLRLICAGLPRSATESLSHAFEELNYRPYHGWTLVSESNGAYIQEWAHLA
ncbi:hypothetical protein RIB2604_02603940 [Aspergillus luchuensis]|uniref:Uncharacterized protein n=1 Tax=Aspergillus kawachii TaxID=1069201 RepID=A0A146FUA8_ASPKA|nr:hypothetical protein RIB2604_02603940 [Aspergillus luchuensis]